MGESERTGPEILPVRRSGIAARVRAQSPGLAWYRFVDDAVNIGMPLADRIGSGWWVGVPRETAYQNTNSSIPPETYSPTPVMYEARSEHRNAMAFAMS
jgi:hypothetical protein